jgi:hypothetical protein
LLLHKPLYYSWSRCQYGDVDWFLWPPRTPAAGLQIQVLKCSVQLIIAKFEKLYNWLQSSCCMTIPVVTQPNWMACSGGCSNTVDTGWTYGLVIFIGLDTFWKSSNSAHSCQIMMSRRLWYNDLDSCARNSMQTANTKCQHVHQWEFCPSSYANFLCANTFTCEHPPVRASLTCLIRYHIGHPLE